MLFISLEFVYFLIIVFLLYYIPVPGRWGKAYQVTLLLIASAVFHGWEDVRLLSILLVSCIGNTVCSLFILRHRERGDDAKIRGWVRNAVILNLLLLGSFKYAGFFADIIPGLPFSWTEWLKSIPLPIGISFYTFHGISMIIDVSKGNVRSVDSREIQINSTPLGFVKATRDVGFYMLFFPQLIAGPIVRARQFWPQIESKKFRDIQWGTAFKFLTLGYFLKMVVADNLAEYTPYLKSLELVGSMGGKELLTLMFGYSFQIFSDFGGYSMIAIGLAVLFGYRLPDNFNFPYISTSITEFWQRWNMTLSHWLRDYLYIPLGGNRKGQVRTYINLFIVMFLGGLWHGAEWKFALWGTCHGCFLALERFLWRGRSSTHSFVKCLGGVYCFLTVSFLWMTFLMPDMETLSLFFQRLAVWDKPVSNIVAYAVILYGIPVILFHLAGWIREHRISWNARWHGGVLEGALYGLMIFMIFNNSGPAEGFIYFQF